MGKMKFLIILFFDFIASGVLFAQGLRERFLVLTENLLLELRFIGQRRMLG